MGNQIEVWCPRALSAVRTEEDNAGKRHFTAVYGPGFLQSSLDDVRPLRQTWQAASRALVQLVAQVQP